MRKFITAGIVSVVVLGATACAQNNNAQQQENKQQRQDQSSLQMAQPLPHFNYSQLRQNIKEIETAQANGVQTTTFFYNQGVRDPIMSCPSVGAPIPSTDQLSNPDMPIDASGNPVTPNSDSGSTITTIPQQEPTGVYSGHSTGTYVMCLDAHGQSYATYWEGFVHTVFGPAHWNNDTHQIELVGPSSFNFSKNKSG